MAFFSWLTSAFGNRGLAIGNGLRKPNAGSQKPPRFRPQLEVLEDRCLPSTMTVTNTTDSGPGSLRADIAVAQSGDTIVFSPSLNGQTIALTSGVLDINKNLTVQGPGAGQLAVSGNQSSSVFKVEANTQVALSGLTIRNGSTTGLGGGILNYGNLTISACTVSNNSAIYGDGGGIYNDFGATLTVSNSTVSGNQAGNDGGGIYNYGNLTMTASVVQQNRAVYGGGIWNGGSATISSSTVSGNLAYGGDSNGYGGGIYALGTVSLIASTVTGNNSDGLGAGIYDQGSVYLSNKTLVCNNFELAGPYSTYHEDNLDIGYYGHVKISGGSKVC
jgi:Chlamydia polymorphic membrane protein (Chlamydia_PMP) repeat